MGESESQIPGLGFLIQVWGLLEIVVGFPTPMAVIAVRGNGGATSDHGGYVILEQA